MLRYPIYLILALFLVENVVSASIPGNFSFAGDWTGSNPMGTWTLGLTGTDISSGFVPLAPLQKTCNSSTACCSPIQNLLMTQPACDGAGDLFVYECKAQFGHVVAPFVHNACTNDIAYDDSAVSINLGNGVSCGFSSIARGKTVVCSWNSQRNHAGYPTVVWTAPVAGAVLFTVEISAGASRGQVQYPTYSATWDNMNIPDSPHTNTSALVQIDEGANITVTLYSALCQLDITAQYSSSWAPSTAPDSALLTQYIVGPLFVMSALSFGAVVFIRRRRRQASSRDGGVVLSPVQRETFTTDMPNEVVAALTPDQLAEGPSRAV